GEGGFLRLSSWKVLGNRVRALSHSLKRPHPNLSRKERERGMRGRCVNYENTLAKEDCGEEIYPNKSMLDDGQRLTVDGLCHAEPFAAARLRDTGRKVRPALNKISVIIRAGLRDS